MTNAAESGYITVEPRGAVHTRAATDDTLASIRRDASAWQDVIDGKLIEWGRDPSRLAEPELIPPTRAAIKRAVAIASELRDRNVLPPMRAVPDGDGGLVFERWSGEVSESIEVDAEGRAELVRLRSGCVERTELASES
jgi:hypothetical protein